MLKDDTELGEGTSDPIEQQNDIQHVAQHVAQHVVLPVRRDIHSLEERQRSIGERMHERMEERKKEWDKEVASLRKDFFHLKPDDSKTGSSGDPLNKMETRNRFYDGGASVDVEGTGSRDRVFRVSFDVSHFQPNEISVRTQEHRLIVNARHEQKGTDKNITREFSRQVDIPSSVDPLKLRSTLSKTGILQIEAEMTAATSFESTRDPVSAIHADAKTSSSTNNQPPSSPRVCSPPPLLTSPTYRPNSTSTAPDYGPSVTEQNGEKIFRILVDIGVEFQPGDLTVRTVDRKLVLHARHEEKIPGRTSSKEFNREFDLPDTVDPNLVTALMTGEGQLVLQAPISFVEQGGSPTGHYGSSNNQPSVDIAFESRIQ